MAKRYFEDFAVGDSWDFAAWRVSRGEIVAFAREHDPQPIHIDEAAAAETPWGGIIASGWQTTMKCIRLFVDGVMADAAGLASPGVDHVRWLKPVRPGDAITSHVEVTEVAASRSKPDRGRVHFAFSSRDAAGEPVMTCRGLFFVARRPGGGRD